MPEKSPTKSTKLQLNADGTAEIPLKGAEAVHVDEPSMEELARVHQLLAEAETGLPALPVLDALGDDPSSAALRAFNEALRDHARVVQERSDAIYGDAATSPYAQAFIAIVKTLTGEAVEPANLYGWAMNPSAGRQLLRHFTDPLGGSAPGTAG